MIGLNGGKSKLGPSKVGTEIDNIIIESCDAVVMLAKIYDTIIGFWEVTM